MCKAVIGEKRGYKRASLSRHVIVSNQKSWEIVMFAFEWLISLLKNPVHRSDNCSFDGLTFQLEFIVQLRSFFIELSVSGVRRNSKATGIGGAI